MLLRSLFIALLLLFAQAHAGAVVPVASDQTFRPLHWIYGDWRSAQNYRQGASGPAGDDTAGFYFTDAEIITILTQIQGVDTDTIHRGRYSIDTGNNNYMVVGTAPSRHNAGVMKHWRRVAHNAGLNPPIFAMGYRTDLVSAWNPTGAGQNIGGRICETYETGRSPFTYDSSVCDDPGGLYGDTSPFDTSCFATIPQDQFDALSALFTGATPSPTADPRLDSRVVWDWRGKDFYDTGPERMVFYSERISVCEADGTTLCNATIPTTGNCEAGNGGPGGNCSTAQADIRQHDPHGVLDGTNSACTDWSAEVLDASQHYMGCRPNASAANGAQCLLVMTAKSGVWRNRPYEAATADTYPGTACVNHTSGVLKTNTTWSHWRPDAVCGVPSRYYPTFYGKRGWQNAINAAFQELISLLTNRGYTPGTDIQVNVNDDTVIETCGNTNSASNAVDGCWMHWQTRSSPASSGGRHRSITMSNAAWFLDVDSPEAHVGLDPALENSGVRGRDVGSDTSVTFDVQDSHHRGAGPDLFNVATPGSAVFYDDDSLDVTSETTLKLTSDGVSDCEIADMNAATTVECDLPAGSGEHRIRVEITDDNEVKASDWIWIRRD